MIASLLILTRADILALRLIDTYSLHRVVYDLFEDVRSEDEKRADIPSGILFVDKGEKFHARQILILSDRPPQTPKHGTITSHEVPEPFLTHERYRFEVVMNPTKRDRKTGKTIAITGQEAIVTWFSAKAPVSWGFSVHMETLQVENLHAKKFPKNQSMVTLSSAKLTGELIVIDREKFIDHFKRGIGRGRAFGFGLLQLVPLEINNYKKDVL